MRLDAFLEGWNATPHGQAMYQRVTDLYPICRSITGDGFRETLRRLLPEVPLQLHEVPTGTRVFDWTVPKEWNVREAWIKDSRGEKVVDFARHNLHLLNYSVPFCGSLTLEELRPHLYTLPDRPDWIPYRTSYYKEDWGFCLSQRQLDALTEGRYEVLIDSSLADGHLTYGECFLPGEEREEVLVSCHACHPSLANDNLSGVALTSALVSTLRQLERRWSYRFLFVPGTIGPIVWLARNDERTEKIRAGLVVACVGDRGASTSREPDVAIPSSTARQNTSCVTSAATRSSKTSRPTVTTSGSTARLASICPSARCGELRTGATRSTTPRPTICRWCEPTALPSL